MAIKEIKYKDWLLDTRDVIVLSGKGNNPFRKIRENVEDIFRKTLEIDSPKFFATYMGYDQTDGAFKGEWKAYKPGDRWTKTWYVMRCWGQQDLKTQEGWFKMKIQGYLETAYYFEHSIQKSLWWTYSFFFYNKVRTRLMEERRDDLFEIEDKFSRPPKSQDVCIVLMEG